MKKAMIMDIQRYSVHDGPGIRSTVFFKGCHMSCLWCHNPESQHTEQEMLYYTDLCVGCRACDAYCDKRAVTWAEGEHMVDVNICRSCEHKQACSENCPAEALRMCGTGMTVDEVLKIVMRDKRMYGSEQDNILSRGGVTCSGGEPLLQADFVAELLKRCRREGIGTCVDTTLNLEWEKIEKVLPFTDLLLVDVKFMNEELAKKYTGVSCRMVKENLVRLSEVGKPVFIRTPLLAGVNDCPPEQTEREKFIAGLNNVLRTDSFYVTNHAAKKYQALQKENWLATAAGKSCTKQSLQ